MGYEHWDPSGVKVVILIFKGNEKSSVTAGTPLCNERTAPFADCWTFCEWNEHELLHASKVENLNLFT